jgi:hypothetical protein
LLSRAFNPKPYRFRGKRWYLMQTKSSTDLPSQDLRIGETVEVKSRQEILATLDERGERDALQFMPEMLNFCGQRFTVYRRAVKFCDTKNGTGMYRMENSVHLEGVRCDGSAHGGCQAGCLIYWKEDWLRRVDGSAADTPPTGTDGLHPNGAGCTEAQLAAATRVDDGMVPPGEEVYSCQATDLARAGAALLSRWDVRQYIRDVRVGNARALPMLRSILIMLFNVFQGGSRRYFPSWLRIIRDGERYPFVTGRLTRTPKEVLDLRPGDIVRVKTKEEILATLDRHGANRGLRFDAEMLRYCGQQARVLRRVDRIINEQTGRMMHFSNDCIVLEGSVCRGDYNQYCPRSIYSYWREIWLERIE